MRQEVRVTPELFDTVNEVCAERVGGDLLYEEGPRDEFGAYLGPLEYGWAIWNPDAHDPPLVVDDLLASVGIVLEVVPEGAAVPAIADPTVVLIAEADDGTTVVGTIQT